MNDLREELDRALRTVTFSEAPVERARRRGRRLRTRRRLGVVAGALAVAAVAVGYPVLTGNGAGPATPPAGPAAHAKPYDGDPVLTAGPGGPATEAPGGLVAHSGVIAGGTMGAVRWRVTVHGPGPANPVAADSCYTVGLSTAAGRADAACNDIPADLASQVSGGAAAAFSVTGDGTTATVVGEAAPDVAYFIVTFTDGQQLKLIPVTASGHRYIAWAAPASMAVASVVAHLGGPYFTNGQLATTVPFSLPGQVPMFGLWQRPGQAAPPRATRTLAHGTAATSALRGAGPFSWSLTAYEGPWGTCFVFRATDPAGGGSSACSAVGRLATTSVSFAAGLAIGTPAYGGSAAPGVAYLKLTLSNGQTVTVTPVPVGNERLFAAGLSEGATLTAWAAYDASGKQVDAGAAG